MSVRIPKDRKPKIIYFHAEDYTFWSHRLPLARAARDNGYEVQVITRVSTFGEKIIREGFTLIPLKWFARGIRNPFQELLALFELFMIFRRERPDIVHQFSLKLILYGMVGTFVTGIPRCVNTIPGLGLLFSPAPNSTRPKIDRRIMGYLLLAALRLLFRHPKCIVVVQNPEQRTFLIDRHVVSEDRIVLVRGSGVNLDKFQMKPENPGTPMVVLATRMLWDKGVREFVEAASILDRRDHLVARFVLVGEPDRDNPLAIPVSQLEAWPREYPNVEYWGFQSDMPKVFTDATIVCLPSYGEGLPKVLLEAAACGRPLVATDVPGCREIVRDGQNGLLVPPQDAESLANALRRLLLDPQQRKVMGARGREIVEKEFSEEYVSDANLKIYQKLLV